MYIATKFHHVCEYMTWASYIALESLWFDFSCIIIVLQALAPGGNFSCVWQTQPGEMLYTCTIMYMHAFKITQLSTAGKRKMSCLRRDWSHDTLFSG